MRPSRVIAVIMVAALASSLEGCDKSTGPQAAVQVTAITATALIGTAGAAVQPAPSVRATDERGLPLAGVAITFRVATGGGTVDAGTVTTGADGSAVLGRWTLGPAPGAQTLTAGAGDEARVTFTALASANPPNPLEGKIAFVSDADPAFDIAVANADGSGLTRLRHPFGRMPAWSPDGSRIAFVNDVLEADVDVYRIELMAADGTNGSLLTEGPLDQWPAWSPDGSAIAFTNWPASGPTLVSLRVSDGALTTLVRGGAQPSWSPDGSKLAFVNLLEDGFLSIFTANADGSGVTRLTSGTSGMEAMHPAWSPDGSMIAFVYKNFSSGDLRSRVAVMAADGTFLKDLTSTGPGLTDDPGSLAWSPDGSGIAFSSVGCDSPGDGCVQHSIKYVSLDGSRLFTLIPHGAWPTWRR